MHMIEHTKPYLITVGLMATDYFTKKGMPPDMEIPGVVQDPNLTGCAQFGRAGFYHVRRKIDGRSVYRQHKIH